MGVSTDAHFAYGFLIEEESEDHERVADYLTSGYDDDDSDPLDVLENACGVTIITHCSDSSPIYMFAVEKTHTVANRGYPKTIDTTAVAGLDRDAADKRLARAAKRLGITCKPGAWVLCSFWEV